MMADFRALCAELTAWAEKTSAHYFQPPDVLLRARAALSDEPAVPEVVGSEWQPCVKLPITVHVREQRPGEQHVSTREGITPVQPDDLIMLGVDGEEYPIGRELFQRTYRMGSADEPAVPESREPAAVTAKPSDEDSTVMEIIELSSEIEAAGLGQVDFARAVLARWGNPAPVPPADGEVAKLVAKLRRLAPQNPLGTADPTITRAADLLERQALVPVAVSERLPRPSVKVLAHYFNGLGKERTICAIWVPAKTRSDSYGDDDFTEYDEESDTFYWPEGWYETIENWDDLGYVKVDEGEVIYWQPIPKLSAHALPQPEVSE